ncbi:MAG: ribbon-helix-helix protein, CopG family [Gammaproteobacteria bacterium]|nr:ribbon-helix-helix protein, CopG family [Gammaproteobacteria bacterium]
MPVTSIRLQEDLEDLLEKAVSRLHRSKNWVINQAVREYLERDMNEQQRWQETVEALKSASAGKLVDADRVHAWLESWGKDDELPPPKA